MKKYRFIKSLGIFLVAILIITSISAKYVNAKTYNIFGKWKQGNKILYIFQATLPYCEDSTNYSGVSFVVSNKNETKDYGEGDLEFITNNKYWANIQTPSSFTSSYSSTCLLKMKISKKKIKCTINDGDYQVGKYLKGTWKLYSQS